MWFSLKDRLDTLHFFSQKDLLKDRLEEFRDLAEKITKLIIKYNLPTSTNH